MRSLSVLPLALPFLATPRCSPLWSFLGVCDEALLSLLIHVHFSAVVAPTVFKGFCHVRVDIKQKAYRSYVPIVHQTQGYFMSATA